MKSPSKYNTFTLTESDSTLFRYSNFVSVGSKTSEESKPENVEKPAPTADGPVAGPSVIMSVISSASEITQLKGIQTDKTKESPATEETDLILRKTEDITELIYLRFEKSLRPEAEASTNKIQHSESGSAENTEKLSLRSSIFPMYDHSPTDTPANAAWKDAMRSAQNFIQPGRLPCKPQVKHTSASKFRPGKCISAELNTADSATNPEPITVPCVAEIDVPPNLVLVCSDEVRFHCHQVMVAEASPIFADIVDFNPETIQLIPMGSAAVHVLLRYIYTGALDGLADNACRLLPAAQIYVMVRLKLMIERMLCTQIRRNNVVKLMIMAEIYFAELLKQRAMEFICVHYDLISTDHEFGGCTICTCHSMYR